MQPRGDPGMRDRHNRKTEEPGKPGTWVTRLDGTIDVPMSCKGTFGKPDARKLLAILTVPGVYA